MVNYKIDETMPDLFASHNGKAVYFLLIDLFELNPDVTNNDVKIYGLQNILNFDIIVYFQIKPDLEIHAVLENQLVSARIKSSIIFGISEKQEFNKITNSFRQAKASLNDLQ